MKLRKRRGLCIPPSDTEMTILQFLKKRKKNTNIFVNVSNFIRCLTIVLSLSLSHTTVVLTRETTTPNSVCLNSLFNFHQISRPLFVCVFAEFPFPVLGMVQR